MNKVNKKIKKEQVIYLMQPIRELTQLMINSIWLHLQTKILRIWILSKQSHRGRKFKRTSH
jgi:hypothetical protein